MSSFINFLSKLPRSVAFGIASVSIFAWFWLGGIPLETYSITGILFKGALLLCFFVGVCSLTVALFYRQGQRQVEEFRRFVEKERKKEW